MLALPHQEVNQEAAPEEAADKINNKTKIQLKRNVEDSHLGIFHFLNLVHLLMEEHGLDGLVDDAMTYGQYCLVGIGHADKVKELPCPFLQGWQRLDIIGPWFDILEIGDKAPGKTRRSGRR